MSLLTENIVIDFLSVGYRLTIFLGRCTDDDSDDGNDAKRLTGTPSPYCHSASH